jgi:hypothetical protein
MRSLQARTEPPTWRDGSCNDALSDLIVDDGRPEPLDYANGLVADCTAWWPIVRLGVPPSLQASRTLSMIVMLAPSGVARIVSTAGWSFID